MASSVRFDTSAKHPNQYYTNTSASSNKPKEPAGQKYPSTTLVYQQKTSTQQSAPFSGAQYRQSPVKYTPSAGSNSNQALEPSGSSNSASKQTARSQRKPSESNALAAQLFTSSEEDDDEYQATSDNFVMGEEDGGDPLTCGDSDFEPAEQSIRGVVPFHLQHREGKAQSDYFGLDTNDILVSQYDYDQDSSLLHSVTNDHYTNAIDYKLAGEHEIVGNYSGINLGASAVTQRPMDNQEAVFRHRPGANAEAYQNNYGARLAKGTNQNQNATKPESPSRSSGSSYSSSKDIRNSKYTHDQQESQWQQHYEREKRNSSNKKSQNSAPYDKEDLDDDMNNDMESGSRVRLTSTKTLLTQEKAGSANVRRFARNTGTYQSSFSKPTTQEQNKKEERSPNSEEDEYHYYRKKQQQSRYKNDSSYSSEEQDILIDPEFKSQYYHRQDHDYQSKDIEMKPIQNSKTKYQEAQARINQKQAALKINQQKAKDLVSEFDENSVSLKSTAVGFSPQQQQVYGVADQKNESNGSKSLTSFGWNQASSDKKNAAATFETAQQVREREQYRQEQSAQKLEQKQYYNQFAMMYPQKQITKETWETQMRNNQGVDSTAPVASLSTQKDKRKKKKEGTPEAHFLLTGALASHLEHRSFFKNTDEQAQQKKQSTPLSQDQQPSTREELMEWFDSLSLQDRVNSLTTTYPIFVQSIIEANQKHVRQNGPLCLFTIKKEKQADVTQNEAARLSRRQQADQDLTILERVCTQDDQYRSHNVYYGDSTSCRQFQTKIIKFARITSNKQNMDTLTVSKDLVRETHEFFSLLDNITDGQAFSQPITYVSRPGSTGKPLIQSPRWIDSKKQNYLGVWIVAILEETLWAHFNFAKQVNIAPGVRKAELTSLFEPRSANLLNQEDLAKRWTELGDEGQQKLLAQLSQTAKEEQPAKFQAYADEMDRRYNQSQSYHQNHQYNEDVFQFCNQAKQFGLYSFTEMPVRHQYEALSRSEDLESQSPYYRTSSYHQDQQGLLTQGQGQQKNLVMFLQSDSDLKEIVDVISYVGSLDLIKYLSEVPLQEVNQRNYMRKHFLCHQLHQLIQENLRQSIQEQLMDELLAIDKSTKASQLSETGEAKKKKKQSDRSKKPRKQEQQKQQTQTYQKKKSISKSPELKPQPQPLKEQSRLASTTTSDDQLHTQQDQSKQQKQQLKQPQTQQRKENKKQPQQKQKEILMHVQKLLSDIVESVCQLEQERLLKIQSELEKEKAKELETDSLPEPSEPAKPEVKEEVQQKPQEKTEDFQTQQATQKRRRRNNKAKKQDPEELVNQFVRKINGGDQEDFESKKVRNQGGNRVGQQRNNQDLKGQRQPQKQQSQQKQPHQPKTTQQVQKPKQVQPTKKTDVEEPQPIAAPVVTPQKEKILPEPEKNKVLKKPPIQMSESQTHMVFNFENQPDLIEQNNTQIAELQLAEEVISLTVPAHQDKLIQEESAPVKVSLSEHFNQQAFIRDFKTVDDIFEKQYDNSQIQFIDYQQPTVPEEQQPPFVFNPQGKPGVMSTTSVSFTPTLQLSPQTMSDVVQPKDLVQDTNLSPPLNKFNSSVAQPLNNNFFNETPFKQSQYPPQQFDNVSAPSKQYPYQGARGGEYQKPGPVYKKTPFRQPPYQQQQQFAQQQFSQKSPTSQSDNYFAPTGLYQDSQSYGRGQKAHYKKSDEYPQQFYQPFGNGSPTQQPFHDNSSSSSSSQHTGTFSQVKSPAIRLDAPSFEPVFSLSQSDAPLSNQDYRNKQQTNWGQFGQQFAASQYDNVLPTNQHPLFLMLEDQFYRSFDKDIERQTAKIQAHIQKYEEERQYVLKKLQQMANTAFVGRNPVIKVFGSLMTGLALVTSDMDIAVTGLRIDGRDDMIDDLHALADHVKKWQLIKDFKSIETASIPVIKAHIFMKDIAQEMGKDLSDYDAEVLLPIDITIDDSPPDHAVHNTFYLQSQSQPVFNNTDHYNPGGMMQQPKVVSQDPMTQLQNLISGELGFNLNDGLVGYGMEFGGPPPPKTHLGLASCNLLKEYVRTYPYLKEVAVLLKRFLAENNLNQSYLGGLSSYSAVLLIVAYMNNFNLHLSPHLTPSRLLMGFLDFYSNCFDPRHYGVNTKKGMSFYPLPQVNQNMFVVVDPVNPTNNTARNSHRTPEVLNHFRAAFFSLKSQITKQFQKQLQLVEAERALKSELESVGKVRPDWGQKTSNQSPAGQQPKVEKASDGNGQRLRQGPSKKNNASSQQDPAVAKASEQQQPSSNFASQTATTAGALFPRGAAGANVSLVHQTAQAFDSVNFVDYFLSSEILSQGTDKSANVVEALSGFGAGAF